MIRKTVTILGKTIPYEVRVSERAQRLRIAIYAEGRVVVTQPHSIDDIATEKYVVSKKAWIYKKLEERQGRSANELKNQDKTSDLAKYKVDAYILARTKVRQWNKLLRFTYSDIVIKDLKSRWGSCSQNGELAFNYRILFLSDELQDYVAVHELCHLQVPNHTGKFWQLVERALPNYQELAKIIRAL